MLIADEAFMSRCITQHRLRPSLGRCGVSCKAITRQKQLSWGNNEADVTAGTRAKREGVLKEEIGQSEDTSVIELLVCMMLSDCEGRRSISKMCVMGLLGTRFWYHYLSPVWNLVSDVARRCLPVMRNEWHEICWTPLNNVQWPMDQIR